MPYVKQRKYEDLIALEHESVKEQERILKKGQETTPGLTVGAGDITVSSFDDTDYTTLMQSYTDIRNGDAIAKVTVDALKIPLLGAGWNVDPGLDENGEVTDKSVAAAEYEKETFEGLNKGFDYFLSHLLLCIEYGHIVFEKVWQRGVKFLGKTTNRLYKLSPIQYDTIEDFKYNDFQEFIGILHRRLGLDNQVTDILVPLKNLFFCTWNEEFNDVRGRSIYRVVRKTSVYKVKLLDAMVRATQRGAGIPVFTAFGKLDDGVESDVKKMARTVGNSDSSYIVETKGKLEFRLEALKNQEDIVAKLRYLDEQEFFNTMTEFRISGIGQNGSRAATGEHKSTYEIKLGQIQRFFELRINQLGHDIIENSPFANLPKSQWPVFRFNAVVRADLQKVAMNLKLLVESGLPLFDKDFEHVREQFGLPEIEVIEADESQDEQLQICSHSHIKLSLDKNNIKQTRELTTTEKDIFELDSAIENFIDDKQETENKLTEIYEQLIRDIADQLSKNPDRVPQLRFRSAMERAMERRYDRGFERGKKDVIKELGKLGEKVKLANLETSRTPKIKRVQRRINILYSGTASSTLIFMDNFDIKALLAKSKSLAPVKKFIFDKMKSTNKSLRRNLITDVIQGYTAGRKDTLNLSKELESGELLLEYTAILDGSLCGSCGHFDGFVLTLEESRDLGFMQGDAVNQNCDSTLGGGKNFCRCQLIPVPNRGEV